MEVFAITIFMSLALAMLFAILCYAERCQRHSQSSEQVALLPLEGADGTNAHGFLAKAESLHSSRS